jgi:hypothetical protein
MRKKACKSCARRMAGISGYKKRRKTTRKRKGMFGVGEMGALPTTQLLAVAGGAVLAKIAGPLLQKVPVKMIQDKKYTRDAIKAGLGVVLAMQKNEMVANAGLGMTGFALTELIAGFLPANLTTETPDVVAGIFGSGRYNLGTGPVQMGALGPMPSYETVMGINEWDGVGTEPDMIGGGYVEPLGNSGLKVV